MSNGFIVAVAAFQANNDEAVILDTLDFIWRDLAENDDELCYRRIAAQVKLSTSAFRREVMYDPETLPEYHDIILSGISVDITEKSPDWDAVLAYLGDDDFSALGLAFRAWRLYQEHEETVIKPALRHAFSRVDLDESHAVGEIVAYIKRAFLTEYSRLDREQTGIIRLVRKGLDGDFRSLYVTPRVPQPWRMLFGRTVADSEVPALLDRLTRKQRDYVTRIYAIITEDLAAGNLSQYKVDESGYRHIKARYMAQRLGTGEGSLKKLLLRVQERAG